ncbi:MAG: ABC transporter permease [Phycisphaeraceae bacterium]|nr:ABC transporter permease [Phycisphaeraceae bacterium]
MLRHAILRLLQAPLIVAVVFVVTFTLAWVIPGNPLESPDRRPPREIEQAMLRQYNLHHPWAFARGYLRGAMMHGDLGPSLYYRDQRVSEILVDGLPVSATLGCGALAIALIVGMIAGVLGAVRPGSIWDLSSLALAVVGVSLPTFVTASLLMVLFAGVLRWLPSSGWGTPAQMVLPMVTLAAMPAAYIARLIRMGLVDLMEQDFIRTARAKGLSRNRALFRHAMKIAFLPVLSFLGPAAAMTLTGSFVVEQVFAIPGLGVHFVNAVLNKDQFLILGSVLVLSSMLILFNLLVDLAYAWFDPRIELA